MKRAGRVKAPERGLKRFLFSYINVELYRGRGEGEAGEEGRRGEAGEGVIMFCGLKFASLLCGCVNCIKAAYYDHGGWMAQMEVIHSWWRAQP